MDHDSLTRRALAAWYRTGGSEPASARVVERNGLIYVVVDPLGGVADRPAEVLAVYRVRPVDGVLRRMRRPPAEIMAG